ncbi:MAG TPA: hypothetical protein VFU32_12810 [Ktedonobacterales bacterium]|nr:hypothetical protein [Ktedonobacterales bacterium]
MPKKVSARHQPQRPLPKKKDGVTLVHTASATEVAESSDEETKKGTTSKALVAAEPKAKAAPVTKPVERRPEIAAKRSAQATRSLPATQRAGKPGQRAGSRLAVGRQSNLVTPEHYRYVLKDLRLIGVLAVIMFGAIVALTFILPHFLTY